ncbi:uncharacterized protein TNIN_206361 [Trichonephila inaurata madagascariensis]|uniref:Uncharacterized protein n=1 Tax=Trichonephila inaurata madagascariensis TaxID=2747483 RepID=A0A8X6XIT6_9ARAC|nr:uncharacterized protein TNIN_206361 [Trichonephila inaurata madagascariensis]
MQRMHWLGSAHIRSLKFVNRERTFSSCPSSYSASPTHFIDCIEPSVRQLRNEGMNGLVKLLERHGILDMVLVFGTKGY